MTEIMRHALLIGIGTLIIMALDGIYLGIISKTWHRRRLEGIGRFHISDMTTTSIISGVIAWALIVGGLYYFVLMKHNFVMSRMLLMESFGYGFLAYGIYNFTNHSFLKQWDLSLALKDIAWGTLINGGIAYILIMLHKYI